MPRFKKNDRILTGRDWQGARKARLRAATEALSICAAPSKRQRLGIVVGRHVGNAVARNRIKRVCREYFRLNRDLFPDGDCVIIAKARASGLENRELRTHITRALKKLAGNNEKNSIENDRRV